MGVRRAKKHDSILNLFLGGVSKLSTVRKNAQEKLSQILIKTEVLKQYKHTEKFFNVDYFWYWITNHFVDKTLSKFLFAEPMSKTDHTGL